jgi:hypothetical protein
MNWYKIAQQFLKPEEEYAQSIGIDPNTLGYMGRGDFGEAYETPDGRVIKVTRSANEVSIARGQIGKKGFFAEIYDVREVGGYFIILQEKLEEDSSIENNFYQVQDILNSQGLPVQYLGHLDEEALSPEDRTIYEGLSDFINALENINREYRYLGIEASDIRPENLGYDRNGVLKAFDIDNKAR